MNKLLKAMGVSFAALLASAASLPSRAAVVPLPPERTAGVVSYVSGGIGDGEAHRFEAAFKRFPLVVELYEKDAGPHAEYTADANVKITDLHGAVVFDRHADGPFMLLRLPAGDYRVEAMLDGHAAAARSVHVTDSGHVHATFVFPESAG